MLVVVKFISEVTAFHSTLQYFLQQVLCEN